MKGAILEKGEKYYTNMSRVFNAIQNAQKDYNWLITDLDGYPNSLYNDYMNNGYIWITGEHLTEIVNKDEHRQWAWAVLSGFPKDITKEQVLRYDLPYADGYKGFWENPVTIQHPLADIEIVAWDSCSVLIISKHEEIVNNFIASMPFAEDLEIYNGTPKDKEWEGILSHTEEHVTINEQSALF